MVLAQSLIIRVRYRYVSLGHAILCTLFLVMVQRKHAGYMLTLIICMQKYLGKMDIPESVTWIRHYSVIEI